MEETDRGRDRERKRHRVKEIESVRDGERKRHREGRDSEWKRQKEKEAN